MKGDGRGDVGKTRLSGSVQNGARSRLRLGRVQRDLVGSDELRGSSELLLLDGRVLQVVQEGRLPVVHFSNDRKHRLAETHLLVTGDSQSNVFRFRERTLLVFRIDLHTSAHLLALREIRLQNRVRKHNVAFVLETVIDALRILSLTTTCQFHFKVVRLSFPCAESLQNVRGGKTGPLRHRSQFVEWVEFYHVHGQSPRRSLDDNASLSKETPSDGLGRTETQRVDGPAKKRRGPPSQHRLYEFTLRICYL